MSEDSKETIHKKMCKGCTPEKPLADSVLCIYCPYLDSLRLKVAKHGVTFERECQMGEADERFVCDRCGRSFTESDEEEARFHGYSTDPAHWLCPSCYMEEKVSGNGPTSLSKMWNGNGKE